MKIKLIKLRPYLYHLEFRTRHEMTSTMLRMAEHYESPYFKGKVFTLKEFKKHYMIANKKARFTYYEDWSGYNVPSNELKPFFDGKFNPLSRAEERVLSILKDIKGKYYLIATFSLNRTQQKTLDHEITHGIYCFEKEYQKKVNDYINSADTNEIEKLLVKKGYSKKRKKIVDEINAYLTNDLDWLRKKGLKGKQYNKYSRDLIKLRKPYWGKND